MASGRVLCSHLIDVWTLEQSGKPVKGVLEEMGALKATFSTESTYAVGTRVLLETGAGGPVIQAQVKRIEEREDDRLVEVDFLDGYRWRLRDWTPDHALAIGPRGEAAKARA